MAAQHDALRNLKLAFDPTPPATLWSRLPASDKRLGPNLLDGFAHSALSSSETMLFFNAGALGGFAPGRGANQIPPQNEGVVLIVKNR
jgi:hypothetical protein